MAADALAACKADTDAGTDALLVCDTTEMADALNRRLHHDTIPAAAPTVAAARGHRVAAGDLIITRHNDASIPLRNTDRPAAAESPVRNGQRWQVTHINPEKNRLIARRLDDHTLGAFTNDYVREHITHGYAVTVHSAQGATADTTHAVLSENATRALSYVALTRGRDTNTAYLYQRTTEHEYQRESTEQDHVMDRGSGQHAARLLRGIIANDEHPVTAHAVAATTASESRPSRVRAAFERRARAVRDRSGVYRRWRAEAVAFDHAVRAVRSRDIGTDRSIGEGLEF
jgi:hypothetical protein